MDLGIQVGEITEFSIIGDYLDQASEVCTYVWGRSDQTILFRDHDSLNCITAGIQNVPVPPANGYNGLEVLANRWIIDMSNLIDALNTHSS